MSTQPEPNSQDNVSREAVPDVHAGVNTIQVPISTQETVPTEPVQVQPPQPIEVDLASDSGYGDSDE